MEYPTRDGLTRLTPDHDQIKLWQEQTDPNPEHQEHGVISRLSQNCQETLQCLIQHLNSAVASKSERKILRRSLASLRLWSDGHGATTGTLDMVLDRSKDLRLTTLSILNPMCRLLSQELRKHVLPGNDGERMGSLCSAASELYYQTRWLLTNRNGDSDDSDSDSDSDNSSDDEDRSTLQDMVQSIKTYTACLIDLGTALDCPALEPEIDDGPTQVVSGQRSAHDYYTDLVQAKFPQAELALLQNLGKLSWKRYLRMQQERDANAHAVHVTVSGTKSSSEFHDSGLGSSIPATRYAESTVSFMTSVAGGKRLEIPRLTTEAKRGAPFECNACGMRIRMMNNRDWRNHLYSDLRPYTCLYTECQYSMEPFLDRQLWSDHLELDHGFGPHWNSMQCNLCFQSTGEGKRSILSHFARHLEDVATSSLPRDVESDADSETVSESGQSIRAASTDQTNLVPVKFRDRTVGSASQASLGTAARNLENETNVKVSDFDATSPNDGPIKCICGFVGDDGNTVFCEGCGTWQHIVCFYDSAEHVADVHECIDCVPRPMDRGRAEERQRQQRDQSSTQRQTLQTLLQQRDQQERNDQIMRMRQEAMAESELSSRLSITPSSMPEILMCSEKGCDSMFSGRWRNSNLMRHLRNKHGETPRKYRCEDEYCNSWFNRSDARLKHYRKRHPHLAPGSNMKVDTTSSVRFVRLQERERQEEKEQKQEEREAAVAGKFANDRGEDSSAIFLMMENACRG